jgi:plasmid maintenance system antidote protein VapI
MTKMPPHHPGEVLLDDFMRPRGARRPTNRTQAYSTEAKRRCDPVKRLND